MGNAYSSIRLLYVVVSILTTLPIVQCKTTHYSVLGLRDDAKHKAIRAAFKRLVLLHHPDKLKSKKEDDIAEATALFVRIVAAWEVLGDADLKRSYDERGRPEVDEELASKDKGGAEYAAAARAAARYTEGPFVIASKFRRGAFTLQYKGTGVPPAPDVGYHLELTLEECFKDVVKTIQYPRQIICAKCGGTGHSDHESTMPTCPMCGGTKRSWELFGTNGNDPTISADTPTTYSHGVHTQCSKCGGLGKLSDHACASCGGNRIVTEMKSIQLKIPAGTAQGYEFKILRKGHEFPDSAPGGLKVRVTYKDHPLFRRQEHDLIYETNISLIESLTGFKRIIKLMNGTDLTVEHTSITFAGHQQVFIGGGLPIPLPEREPDSLRTHGDLFVDFRVIFPERLTATHINVLKHILTPAELEVLADMVRLLGGNTQDIVEVPISEDEWIFTTQCAYARGLGGGGGKWGNDEPYFCLPDAHIWKERAIDADIRRLWSCLYGHIDEACEHI